MQSDRLKRREFITLVVSATAWPLAARAQPKKRRVGALILGNADAQSFAAELREELRRSGYIDGQNIEYAFRSADSNITLLPKLAAELVALNADVIVALFTPCSLAAKQATREIPIVTVSGDSGSTRREHYRHLTNRGGAAWEMCRIVPRRTAGDTPCFRSRQQRRSILPNVY
jgi:ABC-type uncharacterized transport system substrate-binding protein